VRPFKVVNFSSRKNTQSILNGQQVSHLLKRGNAVWNFPRPCLIQRFNDPNADLMLSIRVMCLYMRVIDSSIDMPDPLTE